MSREHPPHHHHHPAPPALSALSSGIALRLGVAGMAGVALWLSIWWALA